MAFTPSSLTCTATNRPNLVVVRNKETRHHMLTVSRQIKSLDDMREYVNETLCEHEQLEIGAFQMTERILLRADEPCGIYFCLHGPRAVRFSAIWETDCNSILFYGSTGERYLKTQLVEQFETISRAA